MKHLILICGLLLSLTLTNSQAESIFIVSRTVTIESIRIEEIRLIYSGNITRWYDGNIIKVFVPPVDSLNNRIFVSVIGLTHSQFKDIISRKSYSKNVTEISSDIGMIEAVSNTEGAIGFVLDPTLINKSVKTIKLSY